MNGGSTLFAPFGAASYMPPVGRLNRMNNDDAQSEWCPEPADLLRYFEWLADENGRDEFVRGAALTREWIALLDAGNISQQQFDTFLDLLEDVDRPGSGYFDLWLRVRHWGYSLGLAVPDDHPWRIDLDVIQCVSNKSFESQLTVGNNYRILKRDDARKMVRIANDQGRHRWYPNKDFNFPQVPARNRVQNRSEA
jgi:hypothetical protein